MKNTAQADIQRGEEHRLGTLSANDRRVFLRALHQPGTGKAREISPLLWIVAAGFLVYFARSWIESLIGM